MAKKWLSKT